MASINNEPNGRKTIQFVRADGKRPKIRLGKTSRKAAEAFKVKVEHLVSASITGYPIDDETSRWLAGLDDRIINRLAEVGLTTPRGSDRLGEFLEKYLRTRTDLKPSSHRKLGQTKTKLLEYFEADTALRSLTTNDAADWRVWLIDHGLSVATVKQHCGNVKTILNEAVRRGLVNESPFRHLRSGSTASTMTRYVTADEATKVLEACPNLEWRLLIALARYAGLRVPSESHLLTWADIAWDRSRMTVRSPKTEHHPGHEQRIVPITPKLMPILQDAFDEAEPGQPCLLTMKAGGQLNRKLNRIVLKAGVSPWPRVFQTLRSSCEKEWAMDFPQYAVSKWIGHSIEVSGKHYANDVPDELFDRIVNTGETEAVQNPVQQPAEPARKLSQTENDESEQDEDNPIDCEALRDSATRCEQLGKWSRGESNPRAGTVSKPRLHV